LKRKQVKVEREGEALGQKLFSIVIATYNCGHKIAATIDSVLSQRGDLYEVIIVDGGSMDQTAQVVESYNRDFTFISEADGGVYHAFNKGISLSSGKYIFFLGAGDRLRDGVLEEVAMILPADDSSFVYGNAYLVKQSLVYAGEFSPKDFTTRNLCQQAIFYGRSIFGLQGNFDLKYKVYADHAFNMRCFADSRMKKIYIGTVIADFEGGGISETQEDLIFQRDLPEMIRKYVGVSDYMQRRIYLARVAFYVFRHKVANSVKGTLFRRQGLMPQARNMHRDETTASPARSRIR
jgi:glycosyltransferase involved in cell wall biosynthesis